MADTEQSTPRTPRDLNSVVQADEDEESTRLMIKLHLPGAQRNVGGGLPPPTKQSQTPQEQISTPTTKSSTYTRCSECIRKHVNASTTLLRARDKPLSSPAPPKLKQQTSQYALDLVAMRLLVRKHVRAMQRDHGAVVRSALRNPVIEQPPEDSMEVDPFAQVTSVAEAHRVPVKLITRVSGQIQKAETLSSIEYKSDAAPLPKYKSIGRLAGFSMLSKNVKSLGFLPYYAENEVAEVKNSDELEAQYKINIRQKHSQSLCREHAEMWRHQLEPFLDDVGLHLNVLSYWIFAGDEKVVKTICPHCHEDCRRQKKYADVLMTMQRPEQQDLSKASLVFNAFLKEEHFSIWHLIDMLSESKSATQPKVRKPLDRLCAICFLFDCPAHGEYLDESGSGDEGDLSNVRQYVDFVDNQRAPETDQHTTPDLRYDFSMDSNLEGRKLVVPCDHDGPCSTEKCSCASSKVSCEPYCGCPPECTRRFRGCTCSTRNTKNKICFGDERCECWRGRRECNPWLCGTCGVLEVLDPVDRRNEAAREGRCKNNRIQLGIPIRMCKGISQVHGWGLYAGQDVVRDQFIGEYLGELISRAESDRRGAIYHNLGQEYLFTVSDDQQVDANHMGNKTRFVNNSSVEKNINVVARKMLCDGVQRVMFYAKKNIKAGDELFYDYNYPREIRARFKEKDQSRTPSPKAKGKVSHPPLESAAISSFSSAMPPASPAGLPLSDEESDYEEGADSELDEDEMDVDSEEEADEEMDVDQLDRASESIQRAKTMDQEARQKISAAVKAGWVRWKASGKRGRGGARASGGVGR